MKIKSLIRFSSSPNVLLKDAAILADVPSTIGSDIRADANLWNRDRIAPQNNCEYLTMET
jgi:hypothetical protein